MAYIRALVSRLIFWPSVLYLSLISWSPFFFDWSYSCTKFSSSFSFSSSICFFCFSSMLMASLWASGLSFCKLLIDLSTSAICFLNLRSIFLWEMILLSVCCSINSSTSRSFYYYSDSSSVLQLSKICLISGSRFLRFCSIFFLTRESFLDGEPPC